MKPVNVPLVRKTAVSLAAFGLVVAMASPAFAATAPPTPIDPFNGYQACSTTPSSPVYLDARGDLVLEARSLDTTDFNVTENFQVWLASDPSQTDTFTQTGISDYEVAESVPGNVLTDGQTYAWDVQASGSGGSSAWSSPCYFTVDDTAPVNTPSVTSSNYPSGQFNQGGAPIQLTFGANGDSDVAGYEFSWFGDLPVPGGAEIGPFGVPQPIDTYADTQFFAKASTLGGSATVSLIPPQDTGLLVLTVASLDRAFNQSPTTRYFIFVKPDAPTIQPLVPNPEFGQNAQFRLLPNPGIEAASPVTSYTVQYLGQSGQTMNVPANGDGTAEFGVTLNDPSGANLIVVTSHSADGWTSQNNFWSSQLNTTPVVTSNIYLGSGAGGGVGVPDTFTFDLKVRGIASFTYGFSDGTTGTVKANGDGEAQITWAPQQSGFYFFEVYPTLKDGTQLEPYFNAFTVN